MEDLSGWKSIAPCTVLTKEQAIMSLKNISAFHANFWKNERMIRESRPASSEIQTRPANTSKFRYRSRKKIVNNMKKYSTKFLTEWQSFNAMTIPNDSACPHWMTVEKSGTRVGKAKLFREFLTSTFILSENGDYVVLKDPLVIEMFNVLDERFPNFNVRKAEEYVKRPSETLIHGDFHSGNVMLGEGSNKGID